MPPINIKVNRAPTITMPTTDLWAQFDATDTASHTTASGLWAPTAGSDGTSLITRDTGGSTGGAFGYGTAQNGLQTIDTAGNKSFIPQTTDATTYADVTILFAARNHGSRLMVFQKTDTSANVDFNTANTLRILDGNGNNMIMTKTNIGTAGTFGVFGFVWSGTLGRINMLANGLFTESWTTQFLIGEILAIGLRHANTAFGAVAGASNVGDLEFGEILIYTNDDMGQAIQATQYLSQRWGVS